MQAIEKVLPHSPQFPEIVLAKDQPQYIPLPVARIQYQDGTISLISCYRLTWRERIRLLSSGKLWLEQLTFGQPLQPQRPTVFEPLTSADDDTRKSSSRMSFQQRMENFRIVFISGMRKKA